MFEKRFTNKFLTDDPSENVLLASTFDTLQCLTDRVQMRSNTFGTHSTSNQGAPKTIIDLPPPTHQILNLTLEHGVHADDEGSGRAQHLQQP